MSVSRSNKAFKIGHVEMNNPASISKSHKKYLQKLKAKKKLLVWGKEDPKTTEKNMSFSIYTYTFLI